MTNESAWNVTVHSDSRMNRMTNIPNTGTVLAGLDKTKHGLFICTADGGGLLKDHLYLCNADGDSLIDLMEGSDIASIFEDNPRFAILDLLQTQDLLKVNWNQTVTSTGTIEDKTDGTTGERSVRLRPNATSGASATITYPYLKLSWAQTMVYETKLQIETATSIALHTGIACDDVTSVDTNTRKVQAEVCTVTNNNWWLRTANGTGNSASDSGIAITANRVGIRMEHHATLGTPEDILYIDDLTAALQKTTNVAGSGASSANNNCIRHSVKNNTAADRPLLMYGCRLRAAISTDENWVI